MADSVNGRNKKQSHSSPINFTTRSPNLPSASNPNRGNSKAKSNKNRKHAKTKAKQHQAEQAERKARNQLSSAFYLHSSADHAFVISRKASFSIPAGFSGTMSNFISREGDSVVDWKHVRLVQILASHRQDDFSCCPICRSDVVAPRITKCGHVFCFPCILRHFHTSRTDLNQKVSGTCGKATIGGVSGGKCPCCFHWTEVSELVPCEFITVQTPLSDLARHTGEKAVATNQVMTFTKLHRVKGCPAPFRPYCDNFKDTETPSSSVGQGGSPSMIHRLCGAHALPAQNEPNAPYSRFKYLDTPTILHHFKSEKSALEQELKDLVVLYQAHNASRALFEKDKCFIEMALEAIRSEYGLAKVMASEEEELMKEREKLERRYWTALPIRHEVLPTIEDGSNEDAQIIDSEPGSNSSSLSSVNTNRDVASIDSISDEIKSTDVNPSEHEKEEGSTTPRNKTKKGRRRGRNQGSKSKSNSKKNGTSSLHPGSMYTDEDCVQFYQSIDGQLCFISGFTLNCLSHDFGLKDPTLAQRMEAQASFQTASGEESLQSSNTPMKPPFPDTIAGRVIDTERIHLSQDVRKRMPVFSHLPLYTDLIFCELDVSLSPPAYAMCRADLERRKKRRQARRAAERMSDRKQREQEKSRFLHTKEDFNMNLFPELINDHTNDQRESFLSEEFGPGLGLINNCEGLQEDENCESNEISLPQLTSGTSASGTKGRPLNFRSVVNRSTSINNFPSLAMSNHDAFPSLMEATKVTPSVAWKRNGTKVRNAPGSKNKKSFTGLESLGNSS